MRWYGSSFMADAANPSDHGDGARDGLPANLRTGRNDVVATPTPARRGPPYLAIVGIAVIGVLLAYAFGESRGRDEARRSSSEQDLVTTTEAPATSPAEITTTTTPTAAPAPTVATRTIAFDDGLPAAYGGRPILAPRGGWAANQGGVGPGRDDTSTLATDGPRLYGKGPDLLVQTDGPVTTAQVRLVEPTVYSGVIARFVDERNYWAAVIELGERNISLIEVKDGTQRSVGFVDQEAEPGVTFGLAAIDGSLMTITIDGQPQLLSTFYGPIVGVPIAGIDGTQVGLLAGQGRPVFADLQFG